MTKQKLDYLYPDSPEVGTAKEIFSGVHWLRLPLPFDLDHINLWLLDNEDGYTLVDTGVAAKETCAAWEKLFSEYLGNKPITKIIVTHYHPDHIGLTNWLCERFSPEVFMTEQSYSRTNYLLTADNNEDKKRFADFYRSHGVEDTEPFVEFCMGDDYRKIISGLPVEYTVVRDKQDIEIGGRTWQTLVCYGHAEGHLSLYCSELGVLISGDQVLPGITTNISVQANDPEVDNLQAYMDSFELFLTLPESTCVLPSHGKVFRGLHTRVKELRLHHEEELERVYKFFNKPCTTSELVPYLYGRKLYGLHCMLGFGEAYAHIVYLENQSRLERQQISGKYRFSQK